METENNRNVSLKIKDVKCEELDYNETNPQDNFQSLNEMCTGKDNKSSTLHKHHVMSREFNIKQEKSDMDLKLLHEDINFKTEIVPGLADQQNMAYGTIFQSKVELSYGCTICKKSFDDTKSLEEHMAIHSDAKILKCLICKKKFAKYDQLKMHMVTHTTEGPFAAEICKETFQYQQKLEQHMVITTGEKPFSCNICNKSFGKLGFLYNHIKIHEERKKNVENAFNVNYAEKHSPEIVL